MANTSDNIALIALLLAAGSLAIDVLQFQSGAEQARRETSRNISKDTAEIISEFGKSGSEFPTANACYRFAKALAAPQLSNLFSEKGNRINLTSQNDDLSRCLNLSDAESPMELDGKNLIKFRQIIFGKLNEYEIVFTAISQNHVSKKDLCRVASASFDIQPKEFFLRVTDIQPPPYHFKNVQNEYPHILRYINGALCQTQLR